MELSRCESVRVCGPVWVSVIQADRRPSSSQVPSRSRPVGASRAHRVCQYGATSVSSYCRSTLKARINCGGRATGISKPPRINVNPGRLNSWAAATRSAEISIPQTSVAGFSIRSRCHNSTVVTGCAPNPRSTTRGFGWCCHEVWLLNQRSDRRSRLGCVVPRVRLPTGLGWLPVVRTYLGCHPGGLVGLVGWVGATKVSWVALIGAGSRVGVSLVGWVGATKVSWLALIGAGSRVGVGLVGWVGTTKVSQLLS